LQQKNSNFLPVSTSHEYLARTFMSGAAELDKEFNYG